MKKNNIDYHKDEEKNFINNNSKELYYKYGDINNLKDKQYFSKNYPIDIDTDNEKLKIFENKNIYKNENKSKEDKRNNPSNQEPDITDIIDKETETLKKINTSLFYWKVFVIFFILICMTLTILFFHDLKQFFMHFLIFLKAHPYLGSLLLIVVKIFGTIFYVPGILLAIASGYGYKQVFNNYLFSIPVGVLVMMTGSCLGCACVFFISRSVLKGWLYPTLINLKAFRALDRAIVKKGVKVNLLLRMSPIIPYNAMNYFLGITNTTFINYLIGLCGFIPLVICYVYLGTTIDDLAEYSIMKKNVKEIYILLASVLMSLICIIYLTIIAKHELEIEIKAEESFKNTALESNLKNGDKVIVVEHDDDLEKQNLLT